MRRLVRVFFASPKRRLTLLALAVAVAGALGLAVIGPGNSDAAGAVDPPPECAAIPVTEGATEPLVIESGPARHEFEVEVARTRRQRIIGLMCRERLAAQSGMLFDFRPPQYVSMWMKNTLIPLDMLFIDRKGRIVEIAADTTPLSLAQILPGRPVSGVLELRGGTAEKLGIEKGDRVIHPLFESAAP